ncbi:MAG TPA: YceI family protein [Casimicrobiaceae bacterium]|nr:YceI family protein [Casimicrobiaceae bacterium]
MKVLRLLVVPLLALLIGAIQAHGQGLLADKSEIRFVSKQLGVNVEGRFRKWRADIVFLPKDLAKSKADFEIELASIDLASDESETEIRSPQWFDTAKFPVARFASTSIRNVGADAFEVTGKLTMKGVTKDIVVPIAFKKDANGNRVAEGSFPLKRMDYKVGEGIWSDTEMVANDVVVRFRMVLPPAA